MLKRSLKFSLFALMLVAAAMMFGCGSDGSNGSNGAAGLSAYDIAVQNGFSGTEQEWLNSLSATESPSAAEPETCAICHANVDQTEHQGIYNEYTDASTLTLTIDSVASVALGTVPETYDATLTFTVKQNGVGLTLEQVKALPQLSFYTVTYDNATSTFDNSKGFDKATIAAAAGDGQFTIMAAGMSYAPELAADAQAYGYAAKDALETEDLGESSHVGLYDDVANAALALGAGNVATYASPANVTGCQKCHGTPYMKHGYRAAEVTGLGNFAACKSCHYDTRDGHDRDWQILVTDPERFADRFQYAKTLGPGESVDDPGSPVALTTAELTQYAYKAKVMNDVHMSHSMEFAYPQSMSNCATCHEGKLATIQADANFTATTCKSCHAVNTTDAVDEDGTITPDDNSDNVNRINRHAAPSLQYLWDKSGIPHNPSSTCNACHSVGGLLGVIPLFADMMPGYDPEIYTAANDGTKYSDIFTATIDDAAFANNVLTIDFSAHEDAGNTTGLSASDIVPTLEVGLYAYATKDFLVGPHRRDVDTNGDGVTNSADGRNLEVTFGSTNPRVSITSAGAGTWTATADVSAWADKIAAGKIKRAEIAVLPDLEDASGNTVALNAPSRTFDLTTNAFDDTFFDNIVDVRGDIAGDTTGSCNSCHDALATTFHSGNRGGNIRVCRLCHDSLDDGSHLELQSRAIDSYVHAIHTFQAFDLENIDFTDPVQETAYDVHIEHFFPRFTRKACEACHVKKASGESAKYTVPSQFTSLAARLSASTTNVENPTLTALDNRSLNIPSYVTGPAYRSCGGCHRAEELNENEFGELISLNGHAKQNGYLFEVTDANADSVLESVIDRIQSFFE